MCVHVSHPWLGRRYSHHPTGVCPSSIFTLCRRPTSEQAYNCSKHGNALITPWLLWLLNGQLLSNVSHSLFLLYYAWSFITPGYQMAKLSPAQNTATRMYSFDIKKIFSKFVVFLDRAVAIASTFQQWPWSVSSSHDHMFTKLCCCLNMLLLVALLGVATYWLFFSTSFEKINMIKDRLLMFLATSISPNTESLTIS